MPSLAQPFTDIQITAVSDGPFFVDELFKLKFGGPAPDYGHSVIAFWRKDYQRFVPLCYTNFLPYEGVILVGGAMTDSRVLRQLPADTRQEIRAGGGAYYAVLKYAFHRFGPECEAFFGFAADTRALRVDLAAGFEHTGHENLIVHFHKPLAAAQKHSLIEKIHQIGAF